MKRILFTLVFVAALSMSAAAQELNTTYFLDNSLYSYRINPANPGEKGFVGIAISNIGASLGSNLGYGSVLYKNPNGSGLVTGLNKAISSQEFLSKLKDVNTTSEGLNYNLFALGFWQKNSKAFHNIEINIRENADIVLPKDMFAMLKSGSRESPYVLSETAVSAFAFAEVAYGYTRRINEKFSVGGRLKLLVGLANAEAVFDNSSLTINGNEVNYNVNADMKLAGNFLNVGTKMSSYYPNKTVMDYSAVTLGSYTPCGFGAALDLGVTYNPLKDLAVSFSILDLGGLSWNYNTVGHSSGSDRFTGVTLKADGTVEQDLEESFKKLQALVEFEPSAPTTGFSMLHCTINLGARYKMPFYERLSVGALVSGKINKYNPYVDFRVGATITPIDWFSFTANYGVNSYSATYGLAASLNLANINIFAGYEGYSGKVAPFKVSDFSLVAPLSAFNYIAKLGVNITFGKRRNSFATSYKIFKKVDKVQTDTQ